MANNTVTISGMFGDNKTYFADAPVIINISGLEWPTSSPFCVVRLYVIYDSNRVGEFCADTGHQTSIDFDIQTALQAIWDDYDFDAADAEVDKAQAAVDATSEDLQPSSRSMREYSLEIYTEYLADDGEFTTTQCEDSARRTTIPGGRCLIGGLTEWERSLITDDNNRDVSHLEGSNLRNGDASTKPTSSPERVGVHSITSWVDVQAGATVSRFFPYFVSSSDDAAAAHAPIVLRDTQSYIDFLFVNRRGAVETCSGLMKEDMNVSVDAQQYAHIERPTFRPNRSLMAITKGGRRSWNMSSGYVTREWAEWWAMEFLMGRKRWMLYNGAYVPVIIEPAKKDVDIYSRSKQQMPHVDFTVTLALEG